MAAPVTTAILFSSFSISPLYVSTSTSQLNRLAKSFKSNFVPNSQRINPLNAVFISAHILINGRRKTNREATWIGREKSSQGQGKTFESVQMDNHRARGYDFPHDKQVISKKVGLNMRSGN
jgi:hypothetical protein